MFSLTSANVIINLSAGSVTIMTTIMHIGHAACTPSNTNKSTCTCALGTKYLYPMATSIWIEVPVFITEISKRTRTLEGVSTAMSASANEFKLERQLENKPVSVIAACFIKSMSENFWWKDKSTPYQFPSLMWTKSGFNLQPFVRHSKAAAGRSTSSDMTFLEHVCP